MPIRAKARILEGSKVKLEFLPKKKEIKIILNSRENE